MKSSNIVKAAMAAAVALGLSLHAGAQANTMEVAAGGGLASFHSNHQTSNKGEFDASVSYNAPAAIAIGFEYGYTPLASLTYNGGGVAASGSANRQTYGGVVRIGLLHERPVQPYFLFAGGATRETASATASGYGQTASASETETGSYFGVGGGVNARLGAGFGFRPEFRYQRVSVSGNLNEFDVTGSLFYTFGSHHRRS